MKKIIFLLAITIGVSCSKSEVTESANSDSVNLARTGRFNASEFDFIGVQHNDIMSKLELALINETTVPSEFQNYAENNIYAEIQRLYENPEDLSLAQTYIRTTLHTKPVDGLTFGFDNDSRLSTESKNYLNRLQNIMKEENADLIRIIQNINILEEEAYYDSKLTNDDLLILFPATSVAKHSIKYWNDHYDNWDNVLNGTTGTPVARTKPGRAIANIAVADVGGAIGGALGAWAVNVWVGPGQVAYAGAIIGTAVAASTAVAVNHLVEAIFNW